MTDDRNRPDAAPDNAAPGWSPAWATALPVALHRTPVKRPLSWWRATVLALVLVGHVLALFALARGMRPRTVVAPAADIIAVRLIDTPVAVAAPPAVAPPQRVPAATITPSATPQPAPRAQTAAPRPLPSRATPEASTAPAAHLYDARGDIILPAGAASTPAAAIPGYRSGITSSAARLPAVKNPVPYHATKLDKYWVSDKETALDELIRKTTVEHNVLTLPGGYHLKCALSPLMLAGGCGIVGQQQLAAPVKAKDRIDNLAPATPLLPPSAKPAKAASTAPPARATTVPFVPRR